MLTATARRANTLAFQGFYAMLNVLFIFIILLKLFRNISRFLRDLFIN